MYPNDDGCKMSTWLSSQTLISLICCPMLDSTSTSLHGSTGQLFKKKVRQYEGKAELAEKRI